MATRFDNNDARDDGISRALRDEVRSVQPNVQDLVAGGIANGRRVVRRRRFAQVIAAGATFAVLGGVAYAMPWTGAQPASIGAAAGGPAGTPTPTPPAVKKTMTTPQAMVRLLLDQLPADAETARYSGVWEEDWETREPRRVGAYAEFTYANPQGRSRMSIGMRWKNVHASEFRCPKPHTGATCDLRKLRDGSVLILEQNREYAAGPKYGEGKGPKVWSARLLRKDGMSIFLSENNAPAQKGAPESRPTPPLTLAQLEAIVTSPSWQAKLDAEYVKEAERLFKVDAAPSKPPAAKIKPGSTT
ncbi:hypothetical protein [Actinopolymorpha alba]|uniref:hypothetical protein n=1 Tax=Actinopolymorpha alba TaxID=533267 RepID=UPI00036066CC|nr:hypothetical protein [Actinopolymorpha alba]